MDPKIDTTSKVNDMHGITGEIIVNWNPWSLAGLKALTTHPTLRQHVRTIEFNGYILPKVAKTQWACYLPVPIWEIEVDALERAWQQYQNIHTAIKSLPLKRVHDIVSRALRNFPHLHTLNFMTESLSFPHNPYQRHAKALQRCLVDPAMLERVNDTVQEGRATMALDQAFMMTSMMLSLHLTKLTMTDLD